MVQTTETKVINKNQYRTLKHLAEKVTVKLLKNPLATPEELNEELYSLELRPLDKGSNGAIRYFDYDCYDGHSYTIAINSFIRNWDNSNTTYWQVQRNSCTIDGQIYSLDWINLQLETDLLGERQKQFFEVFSLQPLETLVSAMLCTPVKFEKQIYEQNGEWKMRFSSIENLADKAGICQWIMKDLRVDSFGSCSFFFSKEDGEQKLSIPTIHFSYEHSKGGSNGYELITVYYDLLSGNWSYKDTSKDRIECVEFYNSDKNEYKNLPQL